MALANAAPHEARVAHPVDKHVGARLRLRRKVLEISQEKLAEALGITFQQVQKYERGGNRISASKLYAAARFLKTSPGWFFEGLPLEADEAENEQAVGDDLAPVMAMASMTHGLQLARAFVRMQGQDRRNVADMASRLAVIPNSNTAPLQ
jgi:transcriptional regulator with XRE-family HTH domain